MPKKLEEALKRRAAQLGYEPGSERYKRYVYGALAKQTEKPKTEEKPA